ncbi:hypothetical protein BASA81_004222 [Batrachochytrium salamandrivorans]|nr:hypothetical protein BASA81_004222 [Batrachochytrium salamandrivorans]
MGQCSARPERPEARPGQGNLVVEGFVRYAKEGSSGWTKERHSPHIKRDLHLEVLKGEKPLGTWRGHVYIENCVLQDCLSYIHYKLGMDEFELLANDEDESIYRELFDFENPKRASITRPTTNRAVGDHRSDNTERLMSDDDDANGGSVLVLSPNTTSLRLDGSSGIEPLTIEPLTIEPFETRAHSKEDNGDSSSDEDGEDTMPIAHMSSLGVDNWLGVDQVQLPPIINNNRKHLSTAASSSNNKHSFQQGDKPLLREFVFKRQDFKLDGEANAVVSIAQSTKYIVPKTQQIARTHRGTIRMRGALVEELSDRKKPTCRITFICSMDPDLQEWEQVPPSALSALGGKQRVESFLVNMVNFFDSASNRLMLKFRHLAGANDGEFSWQPMKRTQNELQLGTNVTHRKYGHGIVQSFDMKGRVRVVYDSKEVVDHPSEEKDELKVSVLIGTRVKHKEKGFGTVKAFDESGRVHVKFDNGEMHRYKQAAWKKKMHTVKLVGIGGALGTIKLSWRPSLQLREGMGRVKFAVGVSTRSVLDYILASNTQGSADDLKGGSIIERRIVAKLGANERIVYEDRKMPPPLAPRDFVFKEIWKEVAPQTFVILYETVEHSDVAQKPQTVRGSMYLTGWLLEPLFLEQEAPDGTDHVCRATYQLCIDPKGFVAPEAVDAVRNSLLLGAVTDMRAYFWEQSHAKQNVKITSKFSPEQQQALNVGALKGVPSMANVLT